MQGVQKCNVTINVPHNKDDYDIKAVMLDFDGTISTLRYGWDRIMFDFFMEMIAGGDTVPAEIEAELKNYTETAGGMQTILQMMWFLEKLNNYGLNLNAPQEPWWYKHEFNRRLVALVKENITKINTGEKQAQDFIICGLKDFLQQLTAAGITIFIASGTDEPDLLNEINVLGLTDFIAAAKGSPVGKIGSAKEACLNYLLDERGYQTHEILLIGDGGVEIRLGRSRNLLTLGTATNEAARQGGDPIKEHTLRNAGAHGIVYDYQDGASILAWAGISN